MDGKEIYEQIYVKTLIAACHSGRTGGKPDCFGSNASCGCAVYLHGKTKRYSTSNGLAMG